MKAKSQRIDIVEEYSCSKHLQACIGTEIKFSTEGLESYAFENWQPVIYDAMVGSCCS